MAVEYISWPATIVLTLIGLALCGLVWYMQEKKGRWK